MEGVSGERDVELARDPVGLATGEVRLRVDENYLAFANGFLDLLLSREGFLDRVVEEPGLERVGRHLLQFFDCFRDDVDVDVEFLSDDQMQCPGHQYLLISDGIGVTIATCSPRTAAP